MEFIDLISKIDQNLHFFITEYRNWIYLIFFLIIFIKTGIGFLSFVPGETLLVAIGIAISQQYVEYYFCIILLGIAASLGGILNFITGKYLGQKILNLKFKEKKLIQPYQIEKIKNFYQKHGAKTLIFVRFIPMLRSIAPFTAGMSRMIFHKFLIYNIIGGFLWITTYLCIGYFFGNIFS